MEAQDTRWVTGFASIGVSSWGRAIALHERGTRSRDRGRRQLDSRCNGTACGGVGAPVGPIERSLSHISIPCDAHRAPQGRLDVFVLFRGTGVGVCDPPTMLIERIYERGAKGGNEGRSALPETSWTELTAESSATVLLVE